MTDLIRKKGRPQKIDWLKSYIRRLRSKYPNQTHKQISKALWYVALDIVRKEREGWTEERVTQEAKQKFPKESTISKYITELDKEKAKRDSKLDRAWSIGLLPEYPQITPEALNKILILWGKGWDLTIREALWVARFSNLCLNLPDLKMYAEGYALNERYGESVDHNLDAEVVKDALVNPHSGPEDIPDDQWKESFKGDE